MDICSILTTLQFMKGKVNMWKDFYFIVKCNEEPAIQIHTIAENREKATRYVKEIYAEEYTTYADDRYNNWLIKEV